MNKMQAFRRVRLAVFILYLCLSSFFLHFGILNFTDAPHQDKLLLVDSSAENETTDPHVHEDDLKNSEEMIPETLAGNTSDEWGTFLPTHVNHPDRLTPPPKSS